MLVFWFFDPDWQSLYLPFINNWVIQAWGIWYNYWQIWVNNYQVLAIYFTYSRFPFPLLFAFFCTLTQTVISKALVTPQTTNLSCSSPPLLHPSPHLSCGLFNASRYTTLYFVKFFNLLLGARKKKGVPWPYY